MLAVAILLLALLLTRPIHAASVLASYNEWNSVGCYEDVVSARALPHMEQISGGMTVEKCLDACRASGYAFAGLEWAQECFCGPSLPPTSAVDGRCSMPCQGEYSASSRERERAGSLIDRRLIGNADEICGGSLGLTVYRYSVGSSLVPSNLANLQNVDVRQLLRRRGLEQSFTQQQKRIRLNDH